jgi:hypothetical protein
VVASTAGAPRLVAGLRLLRLVGHGGEGEVWEARDGRGRRRALKLVRPDALADPAAVDVRAAYLVRINHPALVRVHRSGIIAGGPLAGWGFVEMDYVEGRSLHDAPADPRVLHRLWPLAEALDLLHSGTWSDGIPLVHRDVKPANLLRLVDGRIVLVDPSTLRGVDTTQLTRVGTPLFAAPEVLTGRIGPAADVYSFAATTIALLTGARGNGLADLLDGLDGLALPHGVRAALSPRPGDRPVSCRAVLDETLRSSGDMVTTLRLAGSADEVEQSVEQSVEPRGGWPFERAGAPGSPIAAGDHRPMLSFEPVEPAPLDRRRWLVPWLLLLLALVGLPPLGWVLGALRGDRLLPAVGAAALVSLVAHAVAGRPLLPALLVPPAAWAFLLAERTPGPRRRQAWTRTVLTGALALVTAGAVVWAAGPWGGRLPAPPAGAQGFAAGLALAVAGAFASSMAGGWGLLARVVLLPLWLVGALLLLAGCILCLPVALVLRRARVLGRVAAQTLASAVEIVLSPRDSARDSPGDRVDPDMVPP